jgi:hypothetical protein
MAELKGKGQSRTLDGDNPRLTIDLSEVFGGPMPESENLKKRLGQAVLDKIKDRTLAQKDVNNKKFKKYSTQYKESLDFKAFGKSPNNVNLTLTGDMLDFMDLLEIDGDRLVFGWDDEDEAAKAHGNIKGSYGGDPNPKKARDFFGLTPGQIKELKAEFKSVVEVSKGGADLIDALAAKLLKRLEDGEG